MIRKYALWVLAVIGVLAAAVVIFYDNRPISTEPPIVRAPHTPYAAYVYGAGMVEASTRNIAIGAPLPGIVKTIGVKVSDLVKAGDVLFKIDDRDIQARLIAATAAVKEAEIALQEPRHQLDIAEHLEQDDPAAISARDLSDYRDEAAQAEAALDVAKAQIEQLEVELDRRIVRAPIDGRILQLNIRLGEYLDSSRAIKPAIILGNDTRLHVRVDIDENEAWRIRSGAEAVAFLRGNADMSIPLDYEYLEPFVIPKTALTGQSTERTDRRVLQVIYGFSHEDFPVYIGQQLDVYIQAPPVALKHPVGMR